MSSPDRNRRDTARAAQQQEETLRARWEETQERLLTRFEEPISFATRVTKRTLAWFPVRVWRHFLIANGFLLAAVRTPVLSTSLIRSKCSNANVIAAHTVRNWNVGGLR